VSCAGTISYYFLMRFGWIVVKSVNFMTRYVLSESGVKDSRLFLTFNNGKRPVKYGIMCGIKLY